MNLATSQALRAVINDFLDGKCYGYNIFEDKNTKRSSRRKRRLFLNKASSTTHLHKHSKEQCGGCYRCILDSGPEMNQKISNVEILRPINMKRDASISYRTKN